MSQLLSVSRAARLAGVSRADLQGKIRRGELETFEGKIDADDLLRLYPQVSLERDPAVERVEQIKSSAGPRKRYTDGGLPDPEILLARFNEVSRVLVETKSGLNRAERLIEEISGSLEAARRVDGQARQEALDALIERIRDAQTRKSRSPDPGAQMFSDDSMLRLFEAHVRLASTGHDFFVRGSESILEAAIRSGLYLSYGCLHGNCGECRCRVVSGEARRLRQHEYVLGEKERAEGHILACSYTAVTDLEIDANEALDVGDIPVQEIRAGVRQLRPLAEELILLQIQTPATHTFRFMSGQRTRLTLESGASTSLPVASCPCSSQTLDFLVRRLPGDDFSRSVFDDVQPGQVITLEGPRGGCTLDVDDPRPAWFIAVQDGIASTRSLIEHAIAIDMIERLDLVWAVSGERSRWLDGMCRAWGDALDDFAYRPVSGLAVEDILGALEGSASPPGEIHAYLAGPGEVVTDLRDRLLERGVNAQRLSVDVVD
jgi:CDP-4-dehydro-6-deoxyglucose reductase